MHIPPDTHKKAMAAFQLLQGDTISVSTFEQIRTLLTGFHPTVDEKLDICSKALDKVQKLQAGDLITLSAEALPEETEEEKKRKKLLLFLINSLKDLQSEIQRIDTEFTHAKTHNQSSTDQVKTWRNILSNAKGPLGLITLAAIVIVALVLPQVRKMQQTPNNTLTVGHTDTIAPSRSETPVSEQRDTGCSQEGHITSPSSYNKASITFDNQTSGDIKVYWIDFQGKRKLYSTVKAQSKYTQATWTGHVWLVSDSADNCIKLQSVNAVEHVLVIH